MNRALILLLLAACATSHTAKVEQRTDVRVDEQLAVDRKTTTGPEHVVETVEEFVLGGGAQMPPEAGQAQPADRGSTEQRPVKPQDAGVVAGPPFLLRRTTRVIDRGPSVENVTAVASKQQKEHDQVDVATADKMAPALSCAAGDILWAIAALGGLLFAWRILRR